MSFLSRRVNGEVRQGLRAAAAVFVEPTTIAISTGAHLVAKTFALAPGEELALTGIVEFGGVAETAESLGVCGAYSLSIGPYRVCAGRALPSEQGRVITGRLNRYRSSSNPPRAPCQGWGLRSRL